MSYKVSTEDVFYDCYHEKGFTAIEIPEGVKKIARRAFANCKNIQSVTLPKSLKEIDAYAFNCCDQITSIVIPENVEWIGERAFCGCDDLKVITIPESVREIDDFAFAWCSGLASLTICGGVKEMGDSIFRDCKNLKSVNMLEGLTEIGSYTFFGCTSLTNVTIPKSVTKIGFDAFDNTPWFSSQCKYEPYVAIVNGIVIGAAKRSHISIPKGATEIGRGAFYDMDFENITIPDTVSAIDRAAFGWKSRDGSGNQRSLIFQGFQGKEISIDAGDWSWQGSIPGVEEEVFLVPSREVSYPQQIFVQLNRDYKYPMVSDVKYPILWKRYIRHPDDPELFQYIKRGFSRMFISAAEHDDKETIEFVLNDGRLLTEKNIGTVLKAVLKHNADGSKNAIIPILTERVETFAETAPLSLLHQYFDIANEYDLTELKMCIMRIKHERFPEDEQKENDFSLD